MLFIFRTASILSGHSITNAKLADAFFDSRLKSNTPGVTWNEGSDNLERGTRRKTVS
jgi:hypothetical protein